MSMKYVFCILLAAASIVLGCSAPTPLAVPALKIGTNAPAQSAVAVAQKELSASDVIAEFHDLGSGDNICRDALALKQEHTRLSSAAETDQKSPSQPKGWTEYRKLCAGAKASDQALFKKEYTLHRLRLNDFLFRTKLCESDFMSSIRPNANSRPRGPYFSKANRETSHNSKDLGSDVRALSLLQKCEKQAQRNLQTLKEAEHGLHLSANFSASGTPRAIGHLHADLGSSQTGQRKDQQAANVSNQMELSSI